MRCQRQYLEMSTARTRIDEPTLRFAATTHPDEGLIVGFGQRHRIPPGETMPLVDDEHPILGPQGRTTTPAGSTGG